MKAKNKGFTLIEIMIVVAIIGILAAIALPSYIDYLRRGAIPEGLAGLLNGRVVMNQYYMDHKTYNDMNGNDGCAGLSTAAGRFTIACTSSANAFSLTATGSGIVANFVYTISNTNARTTTTTGVWNKSSTGCWILRKDGSC